MGISNGAPVPVPKASLFKATVDPTKAKVKTAPKSPSELPMAPGQALPSPVAVIKKAVPNPAMIPQAAPVGVPGVPLIKATEIPVVISWSLAQSILSKPSTGGGWQALMGEVQKALFTFSSGPPETVEASHVLRLTPYLLAKLVDKATMYGGGGGYQGVMKSIVCLAVKQHPGQILKGGQ